MQSLHLYPLLTKLAQINKPKWMLNLLTLLLISLLTEAAPLGMIPQVQEGPARIEIEYLTDLWTSPNENKENSVRLYNLNFKVPMIASEKWTASFHADLEGYDLGRPDITIGDDNVRVGSDLRAQSLGFGFSHHPGDGRWINYFGSYRSSSDEPYLASRDTWIEHSLIYAFKPTGFYQWVTGFNSSQNRGYWNGQVIPILGVSYRPYSDLSIVMGFPFFYIDMNIKNYIRAQLTMTPVGLNTEFSHKVRDDLSIRLRSGLATRSYLHHNRVEDEKRFFVNSKYIDLSFSRVLSEKTRYGLALGYSFDRQFYEGEQAFRPQGARSTIGPDLTGGFVMEILL